MTILHFKWYCDTHFGYIKIAEGHIAIINCAALTNQQKHLENITI